jgi:hypothetical protein
MYHDPTAQEPRCRLQVGGKGSGAQQARLQDTTGHSEWGCLTKSSQINEESMHDESADMAAAYRKRILMSMAQSWQRLL